MRQEEAEAILRQHYGDKFDPMYKAAQEAMPTTRAALNSLGIVTETIKDGITGPFVGLSMRKARGGQYQGQVISAKFTVLDEEGGAVAVYGNRDSLGWIDETFPELPDRLVPISLAPITKTTKLLQGGRRSFVIIPKKTALSVIDGESDVSLAMKTFSQIVSETQGRASGAPAPRGVIYGTIADTNIRTLEEGNRIAKITVEDIAGNQFPVNVNSDDVLESLFGPAEWLENDDTLANALLGMEVLLYGWVSIGIAGESVIGGKVVDNSWESFVVKGAGWIIDMDAVSESIYESVVAAVSE